MTLDPASVSVARSQVRLPSSGLASLWSDDVLVGILVGSIFLDGIGLKVFGGLFNIRPSFVVLAVVGPVLAYRWIACAREILKVPLLPILLALNLCFIVSTAINWSSPMAHRGAVTCMLLLVNIGLFVLIFRYVVNSPSLRLLKVITLIAAVYSAAGILVLILYQLGFPPAKYLVEFRTLGNWTMESASADQLTPRPWFLDPETGSYLAAIAIMALGTAMTAARRERWLLGSSAAIIFVGVLLTYSRGAWLAAIAGFAVIGMFVAASVGRGRIRAMPLAASSGLAILVVGSLMAIVPSVREVLAARLANLVNTATGTGHQRLTFWATIVANGMNKPILGHGANSYQLLLPPPTCPPPCGPYVAENAIVEIFNTSGFIGLAVYAAITFALIWMAVRIVRSQADMIRAGIAVSVPLAGYATILVASQVNPSFWGNMYWVILGLAVGLLAREGARSRGAGVKSERAGRYGSGDP